MMTADNSFFHQSYKNTKVLVLAPHPDDEINVAGNMIYNLSHMGAEVFIAYSTNGDFEWSPEIRFAEVRKAAEILGVDWDHIILLGYGDTYNGTGHPHLFHATEPTKSPAGHTETYGIKGKDEFAFRLRGKHSLYTSNAFLQDIKDLLLYIRADIIFCVDYDSHSDHRALSLTFEKAMGEILCSKGNTYHPEVFKRFAYATGFTAKDDFGEINLQETKRPAVGENESYDYDMIDKSIYQWENRVRFPVATEIRNRDLKKNPLAQAVFQHRSQRNERNALRLINSDEVYWRRRTDSISYQATVRATSGDASKLNDFQLLSTDDIDSKIPHWTDYLWIPDRNDEKKEVIFTWNNPQNIKIMCLYGMVEKKNSFRVRITFNQQKEQLVENIPAYGRPLILPVEKNNILDCKIELLEEKSVDCGLAECEFYTESDNSNIQAFIKLIYADNFVYNYDINYKQNYNLSLYQYGNIKYKKLYNEQAANVRFKIKALTANGCNIYDDVYLQKKYLKGKIKCLLRNLKNNIYINKLRKMSKNKY